MFEKTYTQITEQEQMTEEVMSHARSIVDGWYNESRIDWENVWERLDGCPLNDGTYLDLGPETDSPAMRYIQKTIRAERRAG